VIPKKRIKTKRKTFFYYSTSLTISDYYCNSSSCSCANSSSSCGKSTIHTTAGYHNCKTT